jgi:hypothetical protein
MSSVLASTIGPPQKKARAMGALSIEDVIAMERRHVLEGEQRIARQEALAADLKWKGRDQLALAADDLLRIMRQILDFSRRRLQGLEGLNKGAPTPD